MPKDWLTGPAAQPETMDYRAAIGIDLGTTNSALAYADLQAGAEDEPDNGVRCVFLKCRNWWRRAN